MRKFSHLNNTRAIVFLRDDISIFKLECVNLLFLDFFIEQYKNNVNILITECGIMLENVVILFLIHPPLRKNFPHQYFIFRTPVLRVHVSAPDWGEGLANDKFTVSLIEARAKNFDFTNSSVQSLMDQTYVYTNMYKWRFETIDLGSYILFIDLCVDWKYLTEQYHGK